MSSITSQIVSDHYSALAREDASLNAAHIRKVAESFGYSTDDLASVPEGANLGVSCGNPLAVAGLKEGETVIDLGSGAGFDVFQAARKVGQNGLSIGVDMSQDMLDRAKRNVEKSSITNVRFVLAPITKIPLSSESADCIISNCVVNLLAQSDKIVCFREVFRLLRPGGRLAVSDILAKKVFPAELQRNMGLYVGCISGASLVNEYQEWLKEVGFEDIMIVDKKSDLNIYKERGQEDTSSCCDTSVVKPQAESSSCCAPSTSCCSRSGNAEVDGKKELAKRVADIDFNEWVSSYSIYAVKPSKSQ
ncbi:putative UbiE/COQ5 family methyltransferase [Mollisia scopiformis]|uniref:Arsenite methyltransferase n=1 Tax=Mollisia scopiformis TaxID=149040 RepID=A0A132B3E4_MOLSC|nr:putative UbiE/COQ5 family methyltransferase [Mollisia scopiformis]KUJ06559.1 putative UbiE/COQ5 family methyltransferase [Mollisia scopiformis]